MDKHRKKILKVFALMNMTKTNLGRFDSMPEALRHARQCQPNSDPLNWKMFIHENGMDMKKYYRYYTDLRTGVYAACQHV